MGQKFGAEVYISEVYISDLELQLQASALYHVVRKRESVENIVEFELGFGVYH